MSREARIFGRLYQVLCIVGGFLMIALGEAGTASVLLAISGIYGLLLDSKDGEQ